MASPRRTRSHLHHGHTAATGQSIGVLERSLLTMECTLMISWPWSVVLHRYHLVISMFMLLHTIRHPQAHYIYLLHRDLLCRYWVHEPVSYHLMIQGWLFQCFPSPSVANFPCTFYFHAIVLTISLVTEGSNHHSTYQSSISYISHMTHLYTQQILVILRFWSYNYRMRTGHRQHAHNGTRVIIQCIG